MGDRTRYRSAKTEKPGVRRRHPGTVPVGAPADTATTERSRSSPPFAVPGLVLLTAAAILEGYQWLHLIPDGSLRPSGILFAVAVVPATYALTRGTTGRWAALTCRTSLVLAGAVPPLGLLVLVSHARAWSRVLGADSLLLGASALAVVLALERQDPASSHFR